MPLNGSSNSDHASSVLLLGVWPRLGNAAYELQVRVCLKMTLNLR